MLAFFFLSVVAARELRVEDSPAIGLAVSGGTGNYTVATRAARETCPYWNAMGMLLDALEIICGNNFDDDAAMARFTPLSGESVAFVCCPQPYKPCSVSERIPKCDEIVAPFLGVDPDKIEVESGIRNLQKARGALAHADPACASLTSEEPHAGCNSKEMRKDGQPPFNRTDLFCEMMLWQSEQLGDGDKKEYERNGCPWNGVGKDQTARKGKKLEKDQLPQWAQKYAEYVPDGVDSF
jgi:hypothetical protein